VNDGTTVLHLIETGGPGGAETIFRDLVTGLPSTRWNSLAVIPVRDWLYDALRAAGTDPIVLPAHGSGTVRTVLRIRGILLRESVQLVHAHLLGAGVYASLAALPRRCPVICTIHGLPDLPRSDPLLPLKLRILSRRGNRVAFVSRGLRDAVLDRYPLPPQRVAVVYNGVEPPRLTRRGTERAELGGAPGEFLVAAVGNLRPAKDYSTLLRCVAIARSRRCPVRAVILGQGNGALKEELLTLRSQLHLDQYVSFLGFRTDAHRLLSACDAFVLSSSSEGFSLSTLEALWLKIPTVATACGGPEEILRHGVTGLLVPRRDPEALAAALVRLYREPALAQELAANGRHDVERRFSKARMIEAYEGIYDEELRRHAY
jgi:glycosyltransferase involved in cell wall biosynthesis